MVRALNDALYALVERAAAALPVAANESLDHAALFAWHWCSMWCARARRTYWRAAARATRCESRVSSNSDWSQHMHVVRRCEQKREAHIEKTDLCENAVQIEL
jgi:hypothetical protein